MLPILREIKIRTVSVTAHLFGCPKAREMMSTWRQKPFCIIEKQQSGLTDSANKLSVAGEMLGY